MTLPTTLSDRMTLPVVSAPLFLISTPQLVIASCKQGLMGAFPRQNTRSREEFTAWLSQIREELDTWSASTGRVSGPLAVNIPTTLPREDLEADIRLCREFGVDVIITSVGKPTEITAIAHEHGLQVHHDVTSLAFAEKAIAAGVDGLNCIGAGGGGHSGTVSHLVLIPRIRQMFDGVISLAGAVASGHAIRAAEVLGADLAFIGTRFLATIESGAHPDQKRMVVEGTARDLDFTSKINGIPANWMLRSLEQHGIDLDALPIPTTRGHAHLPAGVTPWRDLWSAGQGIELINDIPSVSEVCRRLAQEYLEACAIPSHEASVARILESD